MYWEKEIETMPREKLEAIQVERLKATLKKAANSYHYGKVYKEKGFNPDDFKSLADVPNLPLTTKDDLRENWPYGFLAVPREELVRMHSSSGHASFFQGHGALYGAEPAFELHDACGGCLCVIRLGYPEKFPCQPCKSRRVLFCRPRHPRRRS